MSTGYARIWLTGGSGTAWLSTRPLGTSRARELMFLSERIDARRCETLVLVNRVVPDAELREAALARSLAQGPAWQPTADVRVDSRSTLRLRPLRHTTRI